MSVPSGVLSPAWVSSIIERWLQFKTQKYPVLFQDSVVTVSILSYSRKKGYIIVVLHQQFFSFHFVVYDIAVWAQWMNNVGGGTELIPVNSESCWVSQAKPCSLDWGGLEAGWLSRPLPTTDNLHGLAWNTLRVVQIEQEVQQYSVWITWVVFQVNLQHSWAFWTS